MYLYWSTNQIPELDGLSDHQRKKVLRECGSLWEWDGTVIMISTVLFLAFGYLGDWFGHQLNLARWGTAACAAAGGVTAATVSFFIAFARLRRRIKQYLEKHSEELNTS